MFAVLDSSCAIALAEAGLLPQLSTLFSQVLIPTAVRRELSHLDHRIDLLRQLQTGGFITYCKDYDQASADAMLTPQERRKKRNQGEAEAIVQASQYQATVLVDDRDARNKAFLRGLRCTGSLGIVIQLHDSFFLSPAECRLAFVRIIAAGCRLPLQQVNQFLDRIGQQPL